MFALKLNKKKRKKEGGEKKKVKKFKGTGYAISKYFNLIQRLIKYFLKLNY